MKCSQFNGQLVRTRAEQIVAREPRERVSHEAFVIQSGHYRAAA